MMKRTFGFKPAPTKTPISKTSEIQGRYSPPLTPITYTISRQTLSPQTIRELRDACARVVMEVGPTGAEYEDILNQADPLERYHNERNANKDYRSHNYNPQFSNRPAPAPYVHVPMNAARDFKATVSGRSRSQSENQGSSFEPLEPTHTKVFANTRTIRLVTEDPLAHIRATIDSRPKTSAAACIDYKGPTTDSSSSTSRTATTYDPVRASTGMTSLAVTPANEKRVSKQRVSEQILKDGVAASLADATAKSWMTQELNRRRGSETSSGHPVPSRGASFRHGNANNDCPQSRAGSIRSGIKEYIRPRQSSDSVRSYGSNNPSRPSSRGRDSSKNTGGHTSWWRGASAGLGRKGSWSSFRSARTDDGDGAADTGKSKEVNLNRSLPALPGLDQYKEKKEPKVHIAQLMAKHAPSKREYEPRQPPVGLSIYTRGATVVDEEGLTHVLSADQEAQRQAELKRLVQEKMMLGAISPTTSSNRGSLQRAPSLGGSSVVGSRERAKRSSEEKVEERVEEEEIINEKTGTVPAPGILRMPEIAQSTETTSQKKGGFKARMSRFLGGDKRMVAAN